MLKQAFAAAKRMDGGVSQDDLSRNLSDVVSTREDALEAATNHRQIATSISRGSDFLTSEQSSDTDGAFFRALDQAERRLFAAKPPEDELDICTLIETLQRGDWIDGEAGGPKHLTGRDVRRLLIEPSFPSGVRLRHVKITGGLDLKDQEVNVVGSRTGLALEDCEIAEPIIVTNAKLSNLSLRNSKILEVIGIDLQVDHGIDLRGVCAAETDTYGQSAPERWWAANVDRSVLDDSNNVEQRLCRICLRGARIGGALQLESACLVGGTDPEYAYALDIRQSTIEGDLAFVNLLEPDRPEDGTPAMLLGGFSANSATIRGNVWGMGCVFWNGLVEEGELLSGAVSIPNAEVFGGIQFSGKDDYSIKTIFVGTVNVNRTTIHQSFNLRKSVFTLSEAQKKNDVTFIFLSAYLSDVRKDFFIAENDLYGIDRIEIIGGDAKFDRINIDMAHASVFFERARIAGDLKLSLTYDSDQTDIFLPNVIVNTEQAKILGNMVLFVLGAPVAAPAILFAEGVTVGGDLRLVGELGRVTLKEAVIQGSLIIDEFHLSRYLETTYFKDSSFYNPVATFEKATIGNTLEVDVLRYKDATLPDGWSLSRIRSIPISCYPGYEVSDIVLSANAHDDIFLTFLSKGSVFESREVTLLNGEGWAFHGLNEDGYFSIATAGAAEDYLRLFSDYLYGEAINEGGKIERFTFTIRDTPDPQDPPALQEILKQASKRRVVKTDIPDDFTGMSHNDLKPEDYRLVIRKNTDEAKVDVAYRARAVVQYANHYFLALFDITRDGGVIMTDDMPLGIGDEAFEVKKPTTRIQQTLRVATGAYTHNDQTFPVSGVFSPHAPGFNAIKEHTLDQPVSAIKPSRPFIIDLNGARVEMLDDRDGQAWLSDIAGEKEFGKKDSHKRVRIDLDGFRYERFYQHDQAAAESVSGKGDTPNLQSTAKKQPRTEIGLAKNRLQWLERQLVHWRSGRVLSDFSVHRPQPYRHLINVLQATGYTQAATEVAVKLAKVSHMTRLEAFRSSGRRLKPFHFRQIGLWFERQFYKVWNVFFGICFRYGYSTIRALLTLVLSIGAGALLVWQANKAELFVVDVDTAATSIALDASGEPVPTLTPLEGPPSLARCNSAVEFFSYAADVFIPIVEVQQAERCTIRSVTGKDRARYKSLPKFFKRPIGHVAGRAEAMVKDPRWWTFGKTVYTIFGWLVVSLTILTGTGILRRQGLQDR